MERIFINSSDISLLEGLTVKRASEILRQIMDSFGKQRPEKLLIFEYAKYRGVPEAEIKRHIK